MIVQDRRKRIEQNGTKPLFVVEMNWGMQPVRLTAWRCEALPTDAPTTSVHIVLICTIYAASAFISTISMMMRQEEQHTNQIGHNP